MIKTMLVPLDGSTFAEQALAPAIALAQKADAQLHLIHVLVPVIVGDALMQYTMVDVESPEQARGYLGEVLRRMPADLKQRPAGQVLDGPVTQVIQEYVQAHHADLLVMSTHGRGPLSRAWLGSVADELVRHVPIPILLVRPEEGQQMPAAPAGFGHVLVSVDGSARSEKIVQPAEELARLFGAKITLLRVVPPAPIHGLELIGQPMASDSLENWRIMRLAADDQLKREADELVKHGLKAQTRVVENRHTAQAILDEAKKLGCDLIAAETHGRAGLSRMVLGSVADKVVRGAHCAVLVHRTA